MTKESTGFSEVDHQPLRQARFAYVGTYTRDAPGGWSDLAEANPPTGISVFAVGQGLGDLRQIQKVAS